MLVHEMEEKIKELRKDFRAALGTDELMIVLGEVAEMISNDFEEQVIIENLREEAMEWVKEIKKEFEEEQ